MRITNRSRRIGRAVLRSVRVLEQAVLPCGCVFCGKLLAAGSRPVCDACFRELPWLGTACRLCGLPLPDGLPHGTCCGRCQLKPPPLSAVEAALRYEFPVDAAIKALKFRRKLHYAPALAALLRERVARLPGGIDAALPVPLHWRREMRRGFNQADEICRALEPELGLPRIREVRRARSTAYQSGLGGGARRANLRGAFSLCGKIRARHVLVIDDVVTTGATCEQLAVTLRNGGVQEVSVLAVARAVRAF